MKRSATTAALAAIMMAFALSSAALAQKQKPPTQKQFNLEGVWDEGGDEVKITQNGASVTAIYTKVSTCEYGGTVKQLHGGFQGTLEGNELKNGTAVTCYEGHGPKAIGIKRDDEIKLKVLDDGNTLEAIQIVRFREPYKFTLTRVCKADSSPTIQISLPDTLNIDKTPKMPEIKATAQVTPAGGPISWTAQITYKATGGCSKVPPFDSLKVTGEGETFTPDFGAIYGGKLEITATTKCGKGAKTTITRNVGGLNADATEVRNEIGTMGAPFEADDLKKIACQESRQQQFRAGLRLRSDPAAMPESCRSAICGP